MGSQRVEHDWQPTLVLLPGKSHGQRSPAGYSPWGCKESNMIEQLTHTHTHTHTRLVNNCLLIDMTRFWILSRVQMHINVQMHSHGAPEVWTPVFSMRTKTCSSWFPESAVSFSEKKSWTSLAFISNGTQQSFLQLSLLSLGLLSTNVVLESCAHIFLVAFVINIREKKFDVFFFFFCNSSRRCVPHKINKHSYIYYDFYVCQA